MAIQITIQEENSLVGTQLITEESNSLGIASVQTINGIWLDENINQYVIAAQSARDKAEQWAEEDEDVEVETGKYSAKHWATKATTVESDIAQFNIDYPQFVTDFGTFTTDFGTFSTNYSTFVTDFGTFGTNYSTFVTDFGTFTTDFGTFSTNYSTFVTDFGTFTTDFGTFSTNYSTFVTDFGTFSTNYSTFVTDYAQFVTDLGTINQSVIDAETAANISQANANYEGEWTSLTGALNIPASVKHLDTIYMLNVNLPDVTASEPTAINTDWFVLGTVTGVAPDSERLGGELPSYYGTNNQIVTLTNDKVDKTTTINGYELSSNITIDKSDIGLSNADNTSDLDKPVSTATQTELDLKQDAATAATDAELTAHTGNVSNPHSVTKAQVGLSNADNTSDLDKPVSTATQTELDTQLALINKNKIFALGGLVL